MASSRTTGRFSMVPTPRMPTCGWLMMGVPNRLPKTPGFVMVKVPPCTSSTFSFLPARALGQVVHGPGQAQDVLLVGVADHRHDEAPVERHRHAEVDVAVVDDAVAFDAGVQHREGLASASTVAFMMKGR